MGADDTEVLSAEQETEFTELLGFLQDQKVEVQRLAADGVLSYTETQAFIAFCQKYPRKVGRPLLRLFERSEAAVADGAESSKGAAASASKKKADSLGIEEKANAIEAGTVALQALVNLSSIPQVSEELVSMSAPKRCTEALRRGWLEGSVEFGHLHAMILANLTTSKTGQQAICAEASLLPFLFAAFVAKPRPPPVDDHEDPLGYLGKAISNVCVLEEGRRALIGAKKEGTGSESASAADSTDAGSPEGNALLVSLAAELGDRNRRLDVLAIFRNLSLDKECHPHLATSGLMARMARFLYSWEKADPERREQLPETLKGELAAEGAALTADLSVRKVAAECISGLALTAVGRGHLRANGCYEVLRAWHLEETDSFVKAILEDSVTPVHYTEEELTKDREEAERREKAEEEANAGPIVEDVTEEVAGPAPDP